MFKKMLPLDEAHGKEPDQDEAQDAQVDVEWFFPKLQIGADAGYEIENLKENSQAIASWAGRLSALTCSAT